MFKTSLISRQNHELIIELVIFCLFVAAEIFSIEVTFVKPKEVVIQAHVMIFFLIFSRILYLEVI